MGFQWCIHMEILVEGAFVMEVVVWLLGPYPCRTAGLSVSGLPCPGSPLPWGRPEPTPECLHCLRSSCRFLLCRIRLPLTSQGYITGNARQPACVHIWVCLLGFWVIIGYKDFLPFFIKILWILKNQRYKQFRNNGLFKNGNSLLDRIT